MAAKADARQGADINQGNALYNNANTLGSLDAGTIGGIGNQYSNLQRNSAKGLAGLFVDPRQNAFAEQQYAAQYGNQGLAGLASAAAGQGPSAAQAQLGQGLGAAVRAQMAAAAGARGGAMQQAAAEQQAGINAAGIEAGAAGAAAQLRAQEVQHAQDSLVGAANQMYGTAGGEGLSALTGQVGTVQQGYSNAANTALAGATGAAQTQLGALQTGQQGLTALQALGAQEGQGYTQLGLQGQQVYENLAQGVNQEQMQGQLQEEAMDLGYQGQMQQIQAQKDSALIGGIGAAAGTIAPFAAAAVSDENLKTGINPQGDSSPGAAQGLPQGTVGSDDLMSAGRTRGDLKGILNGIRLGFQTYGRMGSAPSAPMALFASPRPLNPQPYPPAGIVSDERAKAQISPAPTADALLATLAKSKSTYSYKNPADQPVSPAHPHVPGARFAGVMAQDLQKVPEIGAGLVTDTPRGKMLEQQAGLSAALMGLGRVAERLQAIERTIGVKPKTGGLSAALMGAK